MKCPTTPSTAKGKRDRRNKRKEAHEARQMGQVRLRKAGIFAVCDRRRKKFKDRRVITAHFAH